MTTLPLMPQLRALLDRAEPYALVYAQNPNGAHTFISYLDAIAQLERACTEANLDIDAERVRVIALDGRARADAERIIAALGNNSDALQSEYTALLRMLAQSQKSTRIRKRAIIAGVIAVICFALTYIVVTAPPSADIPAVTNAAVDGHTAQAYALVQKEYVAFPNDPEVLLWMSVLAEANGDAATAETFWQRTLATSATPRALVYERGNTRLLARNIAAAELSVAELLAVPVTVPEGLFLQAAIREAKGDVTGAIAGFEQASQAADAANRQEMVALIRIRMGGLMRFGVNATPKP